MPFMEQRQRWSRGFVEAFKAHGSLLFRRRLSAFFIWWNLLFPYMDLVYAIALLPGILNSCGKIDGHAEKMREGLPPGKQGPARPWNSVTTRL